MAAVIVSNTINAPTNLRIVKAKVTCDAAYPTGGYDISSLVPAGANAVWGVAQQRYTTNAQTFAVVRADVLKLALYDTNAAASTEANFVECSASSSKVTASTIIDVTLFVTDQVGATA